MRAAMRAGDNARKLCKMDHSCHTRTWPIEEGASVSTVSRVTTCSTRGCGLSAMR
jgi:uncharacterized protein YerC